MQLIDFIETDRNLKVATTNYDTVSCGGGLRWGVSFLSTLTPAYRQAGTPSPVKGEGIFENYFEMKRCTSLKENRDRIVDFSPYRFLFQIG